MLNKQFVPDWKQWQEKLLQVFFTNTFSPDIFSPIDWLLRYGNYKYKRSTIYGKRENRTPGIWKVAQGLEGLEVSRKAHNALDPSSPSDTVSCYAVLVSCHCLCWIIHCQLLGRSTATHQGEMGHIIYHKATYGAAWSNSFSRGLTGILRSCVCVSNSTLGCCP